MLILMVSGVSHDPSFAALLFCSGSIRYTGIRGETRWAQLVHNRIEAATDFTRVAGQDVGIRLMSPMPVSNYMIERLPTILKQLCRSVGRPASIISSAGRVGRDLGG